MSYATTVLKPILPYVTILFLPPLLPPPFRTPLTPTSRSSHRGQDSAGMVTTDWAKFREYKDNGLVKDVFSKKSVMDKLTGETLPNSLLLRLTP